MAAENHITNIVLDAAMMPPMSDREKALRDLFVREYLQDYSAFAAALRCGFMRSFADEYAKKFMDEPYVRQQIQAMSYGLEGDEEAEEAYNKKRVLNGLMREAHYHGEGSSAAARVSALGKLAVIYGMDKTGLNPPPGGEVNKIRGGVMRVPDIADVTTWEEVAQNSQEKLVADARS